MGTYINIGNAGFQSARNGEYVDKSGLIAVVNKTLETEFRLSCVSRCRRFGKSMAAKMLNAYYDQSCDSRSLFADLEIANDPSFEKHLNKYPVIFLDLSDFVTRFHDEDLVSRLDKDLKEDVHSVFQDILLNDDDDLMQYLIRITANHSTKFIFIIDEWDAICREFKDSPEAMDAYVNWLRRMFKGGNSQNVFAGVYMTGILPIKKYKTQSALNNFIEYSMIDPAEMASCFGFTKAETMALSAKHGADYDELEKWYDGYKIGSIDSMFNPNSVMMALRRHRCKSYWDKTGSFETVTDYIKMNFDGLKDDIISMFAGAHVKVNTTKFQNDISIIQSKDDVLTFLIHLGYLSFDDDREECYIPNKEVSIELSNAVENTGWVNVISAIKQSEELLQATLDCDEEAVAKGIDAAHDENTSILSYNNENSLACVISIAYYYAKNDYIINRELPTGKGFADMVFIPRKNVTSPALVVELKYNKDADTAIDQIKRKNYPAKLRQYTGDILLVGINYDKETKTHTCHIKKA